MSVTTKSKPLYKFTIYNQLQNMSKKNYSKALIKIPELLGISKRQFQNYVYAQIGDNADLNSQKLILIAKYLECPIEELFTDIESIVKKVNNAKGEEIDLSFLV